MIWVITISCTNCVAKRGSAGLAGVGRTSRAELAKNLIGQRFLLVRHALIKGFERGDQGLQTVHMGLGEPLVGSQIIDSVQRIWLAVVSAISFCIAASLSRMAWPTGVHCGSSALVIFKDV